MKIHIEFCIKWDYGPEFDRVSKEIKKLFPSSDIVGNKNNPRTGAFEVTLNGNLVYSKFKTNSFPNRSEIEEFLND